MALPTVPIVLGIHALTGFLGAKARQANQQRQGAMQRFGQLAQSGILHTMSPEEQQAAKKILGNDSFNAAIHQSESQAAIGQVLKAFSTAFSQPSQARSTPQAQGISPAMHAALGLHQPQQARQEILSSDITTSPIPPSGRAVRRPTRTVSKAPDSIVREPVSDPAQLPGGTLIPAAPAPHDVAQPATESSVSQSTAPARQDAAQTPTQLDRIEALIRDHPLAATLLSSDLGREATRLAIATTKTRAADRRDVKQVKLSLMKELRGVRVPGDLRAKVNAAKDFDTLLELMGSIQASVSLASATPVRVALAAARGDEEAAEALKLLNPGRQRTTVAQLSRDAASGDPIATQAIRILKDLRQTGTTRKSKTPQLVDNETTGQLRRMHFLLKTGGPDGFEAVVTQLMGPGMLEERARSIAQLLERTNLTSGTKVYRLVAEMLAEQARVRSGQQAAASQPEGQNIPRIPVSPGAGQRLLPGVKSFRRVR